MSGIGISLYRLLNQSADSNLSALGCAIPNKSIGKNSSGTLWGVRGWFDVGVMKEAHEELEEKLSEHPAANRT